MRRFDADVAVVGLGAMGSAALWRLAQRGVDVIGFDQFRPGHNQGSTHGSTRLFRTLCMEHPGLVPLAERSLELWRELEGASGTRLVTLTGGLMIGPEDSSILKGVRAAARAHGHRVDEMSADELTAKYPQHGGLDSHDRAIFDPGAGVARPEAAVLAATSTAEAAGARVFAPVGVDAVDPVEGGVVIRTPAREFFTRQAVLSPGPWVGKLFSRIPLVPTRVLMTWFEPSGDPGAFALDRFPVFIRELADGARLWGHGSDDDHGVKVGPEDDPAYKQVDPDHVDRYVHAGETEFLSNLVSRTLPGLNPEPTAVTTCMITKTPDEQFVIGRPDGDPRLVLAAGGSGHGFKHASGIGEAAAQITCGEQPFADLSFVDPARLLSP